MRVAILQEAPSVRVTVPGPCRLTDLNTGDLIAQPQELKWQEVSPGNPGFKIGSLETHSAAVLLEPGIGTTVRINARPYRGDFIFRQDSAEKITVVNRLPLEEYLVSALASEAHPDWPIEALKAHAVVSRTMVAHRIWIQKQKGLPFDVTADTRTHLYYGVSVERDWARQAVEATRGQVLAYQGELLSVTFHANCGGHTEDASELWDIKRRMIMGDPSPLRGRPDPYCRDRRHYRWRADLSKEKFLEAIRPEVGELGDLLSCEVTEYNRSGRARTVRIQGADKTITLTGRRFRELLGANRLRSLKFTISVSKRNLSFDGFGWGHGVGLCQWGAYGMARQGKKTDEILEFYFPGAQRRKLAGLPGFNK